MACRFEVHAEVRHALELHPIHGGRPYPGGVERVAIGAVDESQRTAHLVKGRLHGGPGTRGSAHDGDRTAVPVIERLPEVDIRFAATERRQQIVEAPTGWHQRQIVGLSANRDATVDLRRSTDHAAAGRKAGVDRGIDTTSLAKSYGHVTGWDSLASSDGRSRTRKSGPASSNATRRLGSSLRRAAMLLALARTHDDDVVGRTEIHCLLLSMSRPTERPEPSSLTW